MGWRGALATAAKAAQCGVDVRGLNPVSPDELGALVLAMPDQDKRDLAAALLRGMGLQVVVLPDEWVGRAETQGDREYENGWNDALRACRRGMWEGS